MAKRGPGKNVARLNEDLRRELIEIIAGIKEPRVKGGLLTITRVDTTNDLSQCKVYISVMNREGGAAPVIAALHQAKGHVRSEVASRMHIRKAPEFLFMEDDNAAYAARINEMLKDLN